MKSKAFGLDIGNTSIKIASIRKDGNSLMLESVATAPSTPKGILSESIVDLQVLSESIKQMLAQSNIKNTNVALSLPESRVYTKVIEMPDLSEQELSAALKFEMEQYVPLPLDQVRTDWEILGKKEIQGKKTMDVMLIAAPLSIIEKYEKLAELAGLTPQIIETEVVSVHRALLPFINTPDSNVIVHIGATTTTIAVTQAGIIRIVFSIALGGLAVTRAISVDLGIDINQAENYKKAYGLNKEAFEGKIGKSLVPILESISGDVKKAILLFKEKSNEPIKQVVLSGGSALLPGIDAFLTNALSSQVVLGNTFSAYNIANVPNELQIEAPSYNVVVGLALRSFL
ncbi:MAG: type IV pilus assembly protein PilM [Candidatus Levybacteria bacterium GW2011_GWB1_39_7]|nr:MAG: type IV pilus assembly protein PilM [Candidatus Levybacteria bacterium GW2011_GWB1_39_7]